MKKSLRECTCRGKHLKCNKLSIDFQLHVFCLLMEKGFNRDKTAEIGELKIIEMLRVLHAPVVSSKRLAEQIFLQILLIKFHERLAAKSLIENSNIFLLSPS